MDTVKTRAELVTMIADVGNLPGSGQTLDDEDRAKIDGFVDGLFGELAALGVVYIAADDEIPAEWVEPIAVCGWCMVAKTFGAKPDYQAREDAKDRLRIMIQRATPSNKYLQTDPVLRRGAFSPYPYNRWLNGT